VAAWWRTGGGVAVLGCALLVHPPVAIAADNAALGGVGGIDNGTLLGGDGTGEARISLFAVDLALVKQARDLGGAVLPPGAPVTPGQEVWFVLYVDNPTPVPVDDLRLTDLIDESQFTYVPGSLEQASVPSGSSDAFIWAGSWSPLTDIVGPPDDEGSVTDTRGPAGPDRLTIGAETVQANLTVDLPAATLRAFRLRARVN